LIKKMRRIVGRDEAGRGKGPARRNAGHLAHPKKKKKNPKTKPKKHTHPPRNWGRPESGHSDCSSVAEKIPTVTRLHRRKRRTEI